MFLRLYGRYWPRVSMLTILGLVSSLAETLGISLAVMMLTLLMSNRTDNVSGFLSHFYETYRHLFGDSAVALGLLIVALIVFKGACVSLYGYGASKMRHQISHDVRVEMFDRFMKWPLQNFHKRDSTELSNLILSESWAPADAAFTFSRLAVNIGAILIFGIFVLLASWQIAILACVAGGVFIFLTKGLGQFARRLSEKIIDSNAKLSDATVNDIQTMRTLRVFDVVGHRSGNFATLSSHAKALFEESDRFYGMQGAFTELVYILILGSLVAIASIMGVDMPSALTALLLLYRLQPSVKEADANRLSLAGNLASLKAIADFVDPRLAPLQDIDTPYELSLPSGEKIYFKNLSFNFENGKRRVIDHASFEVPLRGVTLIKGNSGTGKSTAVNLLTRLYEPSEGEIVLAGTSLNSIPIGQWRKHVSLAGQDVDLLNGSIKDNITFFRKPNSPIALEKVIEICELEELIEVLEDGLETKVGERGKSLSGGQRQRVGLARALYGNPRILILDEALSAVHSDLERSIYHRVLEEFRDRAVIIITHRPETIPHIDHIIEFSDL